MEKLRISLSTAYGLAMGQYTDYLRSWIEGKDKWEVTSNKLDLLFLIKSIKLLLHKYGEDTDYNHVAYHTLLCWFILFRQGDPINSEYKYNFKEKIEVLEAYNRGELFRNIPRETARDIKLLDLDANGKDNAEKARASARGKYIETAPPPPQIGQAPIWGYNPGAKERLRQTTA